MRSRIVVIHSIDNRVHAGSIPASATTSSGKSAHNENAQTQGGAQ